MKKSEDSEKTKKSRWPIIAAGIFGLFLLLILCFFYGDQKLHFSLNGDEYIVHALGEPFEDPGYEAYSESGILGIGRRELTAKIKGFVNTEKPGAYELSYTVSCANESQCLKRTVRVKDMKAPEIILNYTEGYAPSWFEGYKEEGYTAVDNFDGDITDKVISSVYPDKIEYSVTDSSGNKTVLERKSNYSATAPHIMLSGEPEMEINAAPWFADPGFEAVDSLGNDLSEYIKTEGTVSPGRPGDYTLRYYAENADGAVIEAIRKVRVKPVKLPEITEPEEKTIFLTFDDGPGAYTDELLDILDSCGVKAAFFVTCVKPEYFHCIGRAYNEGHSIGAHSAIHKYDKIYSSYDEYFTDLDKVQQLIFDETGQKSSLVRFPGGSKTFRGLNGQLFTEAYDSFEAMGLRFFDWNVSSLDASSAVADTNGIINNVIYGCSERDWAVVLLHDTNPCTVAAVESIIKWGLENGYSFKALDLTVPDVHSAKPRR